MIVVISGSRGYHRDEYLPKLSEAITLSGFKPSRIVHGANMNSVDRLARAWARQQGVPCEEIPADWNDAERLGLPKGAMGPIRNGKMAQLADALVALWDGESPGTKDMIAKIRSAGKPGFVYRLDGVAHHRINGQGRLF